MFLHTSFTTWTMSRGQLDTLLGDSPLVNLGADVNRAKVCEQLFKRGPPTRLLDIAHRLEDKAEITMAKLILRQS